MFKHTIHYKISYAYYLQIVRHVKIVKSILGKYILGKHTIFTYL